MRGEYTDENGNIYHVLTYTPHDMDVVDIRFRYYDKNEFNGYEYSEGSGFYNFNSGDLLRKPAMRISATMWTGFKKALLNLKECTCDCHLP